ncbi:MAG: PAS domain S-box protein, partial [Acetobacterales bacterium]
AETSDRLRADRAHLEEERYAFLLRFGDITRQLTDPAPLTDAAVSLVGEHVGADRSYYAEVDSPGDGFVVLASHAAGSPEEVAGSYSLAEIPVTARMLRGGEIVVEEDLAATTAVPAAEAAHLRRRGIRAFAAVPLVREGHPVAVLSVAHDTPRAWTGDEIALMTEVVGRTWGAVQRARAEAALRDSEERLRIIVENARDYAIFTTDPQGTVTGWYAGAETVFGYSAAEIVGRDSAILFVPEDRASGRPEKERAMALDGAAPNVRWHMRKGGGRVYIEGVVRPLRNQDGTARGFLCIGQDATERRTSEQALRESQRRQLALIEGIPQLVWRAAHDGNWTWSSPQWSRATGLSPEKSLRHGWQEALHPEDRDAARASWASADPMQPLDMETRLFSAAEGRYRWFRTRATPVRDEEGRLVEWLGTSTDVDDLRRLQDEQHVLVAELQHRTRNLIAVVQSIAHQTVRKSADIQDFEHRFIDRLSALARAQGLLSRSDQEPVALTDLVRLELDALGVTGMDAQVSVEGPDVTLPNRVVQTLSLAMHELATNARKYGALSDGKGRLTVRWNRPRASRVLIEWREDGIRPPEQREGQPAGGYGRELIERALPYSLDARTSFDLGERSLLCTIDLPLGK